MSESDMASKCVRIVKDLQRHEEFIKSIENQGKSANLRRRLQDLVELKREFKQIEEFYGGDSLQIAGDEEGTAESVEYQFAKVEDDIFAVIAAYDEFVAKIDNDSRSASLESVQARPTFHVKLPTIDLPKFDGNYANWASFLDTFNSLINSNSALSNTQKLHYLKACLIGEAKTAVDAIQTSDAGYQIAFDTLKQRYENKRLMINNHLKRIFDLPKTERNDHVSLRELITGLNINLSTLKSLKRSVDEWSDLLVYIVSTKLDHFSSVAWEESLESDKIPSFKELSEFLEKRCQALESMHLHKAQLIEIKPAGSSGRFKTVVQGKARNKILHVSQRGRSKASFGCFYCQKPHGIVNCAEFLKLDPRARFNAIKQRRRCANCFRGNHTTHECFASGCKQCGKKHHILVHFENANLKEEEPKQTPPASAATTCNVARTSCALLSTAMILVKAADGSFKDGRALLDSGSQSHLITEKFCQKLGLATTEINMKILGINGEGTVHRATKIRIQSKTTNFGKNVTCLVIPKITDRVPAETFKLETLKIPQNLPLADPTANRSREIDILLGAELFLELLGAGKISLGKNKPVLQNTSLGWIIGGAINNPGPKLAACFKVGLENTIARFWELETDGTRNFETQQEKNTPNAAEKHFADTTCRLSNGQFMVRLPFVNGQSTLGSSREIAEKRFLACERRRLRKRSVNNMYIDFMREYAALGHMELLKNDNSENSFYLPHTYVSNQNSLTTKLRVVFDGSCKSSNGLSLNDNLMTGPVLQPELFSILIQFRVPQFVVTADISKMYRGIVMHPEDRAFQKILWRENPDEPIRSYQLTTVTYGLRPSSFQAIKCVQQLGAENRDAYPRAYDVIFKSFYVDDALFGADSIPEMIRKKEELKTVLEMGGFKLNKWSSNCPTVLNHERDVSVSKNCLIIDKHAETKTLGIVWDNESDAFLFSDFYFTVRKTTKRAALSTIAQLFDPIGLINPVVTRAKIIMQKLWAARIGWDDELPSALLKIWHDFLDALGDLKCLQFPRNVVCRGATKIQLIGFCDSSEQAYGAAIFVRSQDLQSNVEVKLLCAKSRVAPLKKITLPRLELCGAVLLANLMDRIGKTMNVLPENQIFFTDSRIVLAWLAGEPQRWKTFVSNRVAEVQELTKGSTWLHVKGSENPADVITRGTYPRELSQNTLWLNGPAWLANSENKFIKMKNGGSHEIMIDDNEQVVVDNEEKSTAINLLTREKQDFGILKSRSTFSKLVKTVACWRRVMMNLINKARGNPQVLGAITSADTEAARKTVLRLVQQEALGEVLNCLKKGKVVGASGIRALNPFVDGDGLIRVGGRLRNAQESCDTRHPILLPKHYVTELLIKEVHQKQLHTGHASTLAAVRRVYWPISGRNQVKKVIRSCIRCFRVNPVPYDEIMGNLPVERVTVARPFVKIGVDFGGPVLIKEGKGRGKRLVKSYIGLFVCLTTKAIHLELVSDLTTDAFLAALNRLVARRGHVETIISDNATNFVGAQREMAKFLSLLKNQVPNSNINWKFIPPRAPHFGGLAEAGIKSVKRHIKRVIGESHLTYEEMYTLLAKIEAVLNSRPLTPLSNDPNDLEVLTPGHFLIGQAMTAPPQEELLDVPINRLSRWKLVEACRQHFWKRWSHEYLSTLQGRSKWQRSPERAPKIGAMVLVKEDNIAPLQWRLGRIVAVHPGTDGKVRVVTVQCKHGKFKRAITKLCPLPLDD